MCDCNRDKQNKCFIFVPKLKLKTMLAHYIDILLFGMASTKCLLLLLPLLQLDKVKEDANSDKLINNILNKHSQFKNNSDVNDMLKRIFYDDFKTETYLNQNNISYLYELRLLKESFVKLYVESINNLTG